MENKNFDSAIKNGLFLTEERLGNFLSKLFTGLIFERDKVVPGSGIKHRADFRNDDIMLIVEFDGYQHYTQSKRIIADKLKDKIYSSMGYEIWRIPYFIQISKDVILKLLNKCDTNKYAFNWIEKNIDIKYFDLLTTQQYPHGFIDSKLEVLPADFCELGIQKFNEDIKYFDFIWNDIKNSLLNKYKEKLNHPLAIEYPEFIKSLIVPKEFYSIFN